jgi:diketogulonate reductase-like aldo/keto reductase
MSIAVSKKVGKLWTKVLPLNNGREIPQVGLGCYHIEEKGALITALDNGYKHFDTAGFYKNDKWVGQEVQQHAFMNAWTREDYFICSKIPPAFCNEKRAGGLIKASVKAVNQGYLDCMLLLWPGTQKIDENDQLNIDNRHGCWKVMEESVEEGLIKGAGVSNFQTRHLEKLMQFSSMKPILN